jgi:hypothetical protein
MQEVRITRVLSVDLAYKSYEDCGIVVLEAHNNTFSTQVMSPRDLDLTGLPSPKDLGAKLAYACRHLAASIIILDGPQGWKHPDNGLEYCRYVNVN